MPNMKSFAGIEYAGIAGVSKACMDAVMRFVQFGEHIAAARILSHQQEHCLILTIGDHDLVAIKSGFTSGYSGEGPRSFSYVLELLHAHGAEIEEYEVEKAVIDRVDSSCLTLADVAALEKADPVRPSRWADYVSEEDWSRQTEGTVWARFEPVMPLAIVDPRLADVALRFWRAPDECLLTGYRRLEDIIRKRIGEEEHGAKLFSVAFQGEDARLRWKDIKPAEQTGRANLFIGAYMAYRNRRAHREPEDHGDRLLDEFLLLNHLFRLETEATGPSRRDESAAA